MKFRPENLNQINLNGKNRSDRIEKKGINQRMLYDWFLGYVCGDIRMVVWKRELLICLTC